MPGRRVGVESEAGRELALAELFAGAMLRPMLYVVPLSMGPLGSPIRRRADGTAEARRALGSRARRSAAGEENAGSGWSARARDDAGACGGQADDDGGFGLHRMDRVADRAAR